MQDIPIDQNGQRTNVYQFIQDMANELHIGQIDRGFNGVQMRIWLNYKFKDSAQLIIFQKKQQQWTAHLYSYVTGYDSITRKAIVDTNQLIRKSSNPKSGWKTFLSKIYDLKIADLPDSDVLLNGRYDIAEADIITFELATKKVYRLYSYLNTRSFKDEFWQANNIESMFGLIDSEFDFKRLSR